MWAESSKNFIRSLTVNPKKNSPSPDFGGVQQTLLTSVRSGGNVTTDPKYTFGPCLCPVLYTFFTECLQFIFSTYFSSSIRRQSTSQRRSFGPDASVDWISAPYHDRLHYWLASNHDSLTRGKALLLCLVDKNQRTVQSRSQVIAETCTACTPRTRNAKVHVSRKCADLNCLSFFSGLTVFADSWLVSTLKKN